jgi:hypothetical protein
MGTAVGKNTEGLFDVNDVAINSMGASWTSRPVPMAGYRNFGIHLFWDNSTPRGEIRLEYTCDPRGENGDVDSWVSKTAINVDGSFENLMILDAQLSIAAFRLVYTRTDGTSALRAFIVRGD